MVEAPIFLQHARQLITASTGCAASVGKLVRCVGRRAEPGGLIEVETALTFASAVRDAVDVSPPGLCASVVYWFVHD